MKKLLLKALLLVGVLSNLACSNQWRESDPGVDSEYVMSLFNEISDNGSTKSANFDASALSASAADPYSTMYFAESGPAMGAVGSIFSFSDASFLGTFNGQDVPTYTNVFDLMDGYGLDKVSVIFLDGVVEESRVFTLMLKLEAGGAGTYFMAQSSDYQLDDNEFSVNMRLSNGIELVLRSNDISPDVEDELAGTIQLRAFVRENGVDYKIGQFSVLHGFGGQN